MATGEDSLALPSGEPEVAENPLGVFSRPRDTSGFAGWLTSVDHKRIAILYGGAALFFLLWGGAPALLIRLQLALPNNTMLSEDAYNQISTTHGTVMVFLFAMPMAAAFANYLMPLQVGARNVAFPRLNAYSFWVFLLGGIMLNTSWFLGGAPKGGWFNYAPDNGLVFSPSAGIDLWNVGLLIAGIGSLTSAINLIVTALNMRAPGMTLMKMPLFVWMTLVSQFLLLFAIPVLSVAQLLLLLDRQFDANFFNVGQGADPLLWHHLFWIFGHPEVYLMVLPAFGLASEIIPLFARKPIFGYRFMVYAGITIGLLGWGVWVYHMLVTGVGPLSASAFTVATWFIVIPTGVMIFNWISTMRGTKITLNTPMLFAIGLVIQFTIGGLAGGLSQALSRSDPELTDTYLIVAHFHYVLFGGALFGFMAGFYVYWPKIFGYLLNDRVGKWHFWFMVVGFNLTFGSMHILGLQDMERGIQTYDTAEGFNLWNMAATIGAFILAPATLMILVNALYSYAKWNEAGRPDPGPDPWDGRTLEWSIQSPAPCHNFDASPIVSSVDDFWHRKYAEDETGEIRRIATGEELAQPGNPEGVHVPAPSYWPIVGALGLPLVGYGIIFSMWLVIPGVILVLAGAFGWAFEPTDDLDLGTSGGDDHGHGGNHDADPDSGGVGDELLETVR